MVWEESGKKNSSNFKQISGARTSTSRPERLPAAPGLRPRIPSYWNPAMPKLKISFGFASPILRNTEYKKLADLDPFYKFAYFDSLAGEEVP